ncbi:transketolase [Micromonospora viridifaciens]|uniref:Transketolase n=1 Tax=Micromonospora viridifaciens TaxID=1881 RepID=A0A1C4W7Y0_MICVI|nr:transketolase [Micromonospora viridifaciens]SCE92283.1 transketolase [Micromonospora viridifaciens]
MAANRPELPALNWSDLDRRAVDTVRVLAMDAVEKSGNGHPGTAMSLAPAAYLLFNRVMRHNPAAPDWAGRDRFVLSAGHSSLTLYIQLFLSGYPLSLDDLKALRQWGSLTPGHPEHGHTPGVETTTGPLGQGLGNAVGMAMAARRERGLFDPAAEAGESPFDHDIWCIASDGDIEEGISHEVSALAGHQQLGNLCVIYDDNEISIEDDTRIAKSEDVAARYEAYGWHVQTVDWRRGDADQGDYHEDVEALYEALLAARAETGRPSFIALRTIIGWPAPNKKNTGKIHGSALGADEVKATKEILGFDPQRTFQVDEEVLKHSRQVMERGAAAQAEWTTAFDAWAQANPERKALWDRMAGRKLPEGWADALPTFPADAKGIATRAASGKVLEALAPVLPELWGGSADLAESNNTTMKGEPSFIPANHATKEFPGHEYGRTLHFGIREHAMGAILNGIALHGGTRPYGGTFLVFSDYMRPSVRLAALMKLPVVYVWTHDSIGLGEDGPTHQPVEHLTSLRAIPGLDVVRPADANETAWAWRQALEHSDRPTALALSRQPLPTLDRTELAGAEGVAKGGYVLAEASTGMPQVILVGTGSEVQLCLTARERLEADGTPTRVVSMPCQEWFFAQDEAYRESVLPRGVKARVSVEAGIAMSWRRIVGDSGESVSLEHYGASAPHTVLFEQFGFTPDRIVAAAHAALTRVGDITGSTTGN